MVVWEEFKMRLLPPAYNHQNTLMLRQLAVVMVFVTTPDTL